MEYFVHKLQNEYKMAIDKMTTERKTHRRQFDSKMSEDLIAEVIAMIDEDPNESMRQLAKKNSKDLEVHNPKTRT